MGGACTAAALAGLIAAATATGVAQAAPVDAIRTGGPSDPGDAKRAVILSSGSLAGKRFTVTNSSGKVVLRGRLTRAAGGARPWRKAAIADLSAVDEPGAYRVKVGRLKAARKWIVSQPGVAAEQGDPARTALLRDQLRRT